MNARPHIPIGGRRVLAATCLGCGDLVTNPERRHRGRGRFAYLDRRCGVCRWRHLEGTKRPLHQRG